MVKKEMMTSVVASDVGRWAVVVKEKTLCIGILCHLPYLSFFLILLVKLMFHLLISVIGYTHTVFRDFLSCCFSLTVC